MTTDNSYKIISADKLFDAIENDLTDNNFKTAAEFLNEAVTDWPTFNLKEPADLLTELKKEVQGKLTYTNLGNYYNRIDLNVDAWKSTAVSSLLEMFDFERKNVFDKNIELENIIDKISRHYLKI
jgi:hypothetical protein